MLCLHFKIESSPSRLLELRRLEEIEDPIVVFPLENILIPPLFDFRISDTDFRFQVLLDSSSRLKEYRERGVEVEGSEREIKGLRIFTFLD